MFAFTKPNTLLGIDISSTAVKLVELRKKAKSCKVESYAVVPLPEGATNEGNLLDAELVSKAIKHVIKKSRTRIKHCALAIPTSMIVSKQITVPNDLDEEDLDILIRLEAERYIPYPIDNVHLDYTTLGTTTDGNHLDILLVATRSENVELRVAAAEMAGLQVELVDVESHIIEKVMNELIEDTHHHELIAILDYGAVTTSISLFKHGQLIFSQEQVFGGKQLTLAIMQRFGLDLQQAGEAKKTANLPESYITEVLEPFKNRMTKQLNRFLQLFYAATHENHVDRILLAGGCSLIPGIDEHIQMDLGISTVIVNPFLNCTLGHKVDPQRFTSDIPALMHAAGLSLRGLNP